MQSTLNHLGTQFLHFAWAMFWQSSLLIVLIFALDWLLARKWRASVRHALWLVVLVKLLLPPALALPTSAAWWLFPAQPAAPEYVPQNYAIVYGQMTNPAFSTSPVKSPGRTAPQALNGAGWALVFAATVGLSLMVWLLFRWLQVTRMVSRARSLETFSALLDELQPTAGSSSPIRVKTVEDRISPAVCGLFRPVILLPRTLAETLSAEQVRAVLLHEIIHIRRKDIWINCAQALLQVAYWWHPLVWVANTRIRRVREEAVDDAVMLALADQAEAYAPTLLEVARLALRRPRVSLGLVGIMESRSALRQRIERLVDFQPPRQAGLTLASLAAIVLFSTVALPMGEAPTPPSPNADDDSSMTRLASASPQSSSVRPTVLLEAKIYQLRPEDLRNLLSGMEPKPGQSGQDLWWAVSPDQCSKLETRVRQFGFSLVTSPRIQTSSGTPAEFFVGNRTHGTDIECLPNVNAGQIDLTVRGEITDQSANVGITNRFGIRATLENHGGAVIPVENDPSNSVIFLQVESPVNPPAMHNSTSPGSIPQPPGATEADGNSPAVPRAESSRLPAADGRLFQRTFKVDINALSAGLHLPPSAPGSRQSDVPSAAVITALRQRCAEAGVDWQSPPGKSVFYNDRLGLLFVRATASDLDKIETVVQKLVFQPPDAGPSIAQVHIKARFYQVPADTFDSFQQYLNATNPWDGKPMGILDPETAQAARDALASKSGTEMLAEPEVTTTGGRQTQMRATEVVAVVTGMELKEEPDSTNAISPRTQQIETGPILDAVPLVLADGRTIALSTTAFDVKFHGYVKPPHDLTTRWVTNSSGVAIKLPNIWPAVQNAHESASVNLPDNDTLALALNSRDVVQCGERDSKRDDFIAQYIDDDEARKGRTKIVVLVTATLVDAAGNRIHVNDQPGGASPPKALPAVHSF